MRIGELAGLVGISTRAIRHYHRVGLLAEPARTANGYREYSLRDAAELARVRRLTELGLSLDEVGDALAGSAADDPRVKATAQAIVAAVPEPARRAIQFPDGDLEETYVSHEFYRIAGGLIAEEWICSDTASLFRQLS
jgi:DNA-binding transcriptional MerR regulator